MSFHLEIRDLSKLYGQTLALDKVSLQVEEGELCVLLGPSGSGKSTILKVVAGLVSPTSGRVLLRSKDITDIPIHERNIGLVIQSYALFPHLTAFENVAFPLRTPIHRCNRVELDRRVRGMFALTGLEGLEDRKPSELSGGQQQRVALARALVFDPEVLLLDEPLAALDRELRERMQEEIRRIHRALRMTVVYVTHDQSEAMKVADRIAILNRGRLVQAGSPVDLYEMPQDEFVAQFLGGANLVSGRVTSVQDGVLCIVAGGCELRAPTRDGISPGSQVTLMVRWEKVRLGIPPADSNHLPGTIVDMRYLGSMLQIIVSLGDGTLWRSNMPPTTPLLQVGTQTQVHWRIDDAHALPVQESPRNFHLKELQ